MSDFPPNKDTDQDMSLIVADGIKSMIDRVEGTECEVDLLTMIAGTALFGLCDIASPAQVTVWLRENTERFEKLAAKQGWRFIQ